MSMCIRRLTGTVAATLLGIAFAMPAAAELANAQLKDGSGRAVGVADLDRTRRGLALAWLGSRVLSRSHIVHFDAIASVRAAFSPREALELLYRLKKL